MLDKLPLLARRLLTSITLGPADAMPEEIGEERRHLGVLHMILGHHEVHKLLHHSVSDLAALTRASFDRLPLLLNLLVAASERRHAHTSLL